MKSNKNGGNIKQVIFGVIVALAVIFIVVAQLWKNDLLPSGDNLWSKSVSDDSTDTSSVDTNSSFNGDNINIPEGFVGIGQEFFSEGENTKYIANNIRVTKEIDGFPIPTDAIIDGAELDENGTITNNYSYVVISITIKYLGDEKSSIGINNNILLRDGHEMESSDEVFYSIVCYSENTQRQHLKDYYIYELGPFQESTFELVFMVRDDIYENDSLILLMSGASGGGSIGNTGDDSNTENPLEHRLWLANKEK